MHADGRRHRRDASIICSHFTAACIQPSRSCLSSIAPRQGESSMLCPCYAHAMPPLVTPPHCIAAAGCGNIVPWCFVHACMLFGILWLLPHGVTRGITSVCIMRGGGVGGHAATPPIQCVFTESVYSCACMLLMHCRRYTYTVSVPALLQQHHYASADKLRLSQHTSSTASPSRPWSDTSTVQPLSSLSCC